ncbi:hypothetical protein TRFO_07062 [Tritrichomonas foetus]|uniref:Uncharacterized protein n=1 Tax=Tritrichomonas foetus TaxID=1144522 RepID=A0A1J4JUF8_9EUKA|nr:hypothetical protein TRFO_07062 [Tritrichomonas foetus]|eukprot:OHT02635.1 hypothetical protein TRFO_07062 [Tritrichomonas foetus]
MANVFSDCPFIFLTRTHRISITQLNETFAKTGSKLPSALLANLKADCEMKDSISHIQRMKHIYSLLRDIVDISTYNEDYLPRFIYDILPLAGFAAYELKTSLIKETVNDVTAQLLSLIVELAKLFSKYQDTLSRFFLYNLTTVDLDYFNQLLNNYRDSGEEWQRKVINQLIDISGQIQQFDLEEFDNGVRYEITPLIVTIGRIFYSFNDVKTKQRASFLNTLFEHLMTILLHCKIMNSPLDAFLDICPIHQFWSFRKTLFRYTENYPGGIHTYASFITLAAFFNKDSVCLSLFSAEERQINDFINKSRASLLTSVQNMLAEYLKPESKIFQIVNQNRFSKVFNQSEFIKYRLVSQDGKPSDAEYREKIWQLKELMRMLPGSISTGTGNLSIADYIANNLTNHMNLILFNQLTATPDWVDGAFSSATQILWPLYTLLGESFPRKLMECRFENSTYDNQTSYLELIASIRDGDKLLEENGAKKKIIEMFQSRLNQFITTDYVKTVYRPYGKCFDNLGKLEYQADEFFSESGFKYLIASLGLHSGFILDRLLINKAANSMHRIFKIYESLSSQMNAWYSDFRESGTAWFAAQNENAIVVASNEMIHLGVILMTRRLLRETMSESAKISIPGLMPILTAAFIRNPELLSQKEELIDEVISGRNSFKLIEVALSTKEIQQTSDPIQFFFFLAVIMINPQFDDIKYSPDNEVLTYNLHLIPTAVDAFINLLKCFCTSNDTKIISTGMQFYFSVLQRIVQKKRTDLANQSSKSSSSKLSSSSINALIILADLFPKYVKCIEYGRIGINFPYSVITEAYREVESQYASLQNRLDRKKGGK